MRRRSRAGGEPAKAQRRKTGARKSRIAPKAARRRSSSDATRETEVARLTRELHEALQQQTATAEVLRVISRVPIRSANCTRYPCAVGGAAVRGGDCRTSGGRKMMPTAWLPATDPRSITKTRNIWTLSPSNPTEERCTGRTLLEGKTVHVHDVQADPDYNPNFGRGGPSQCYRRGLSHRAWRSPT